jgi:chromate transport protein ChrA
MAFRYVVVEKYCLTLPTMVAILYYSFFYARYFDISDFIQVGLIFSLNFIIIQVIFAATNEQIKLRISVKII